MTRGRVRRAASAVLVVGTTAIAACTAGSSTRSSVAPDSVVADPVSGDLGAWPDSTEARDMEAASTEVGSPERTGNGPPDTGLAVVTVPPGVQLESPVDLPAGFVVGASDVASDGAVSLLTGWFATSESAPSSGAAAAVTATGRAWELVAMAGAGGYAVEGVGDLRFAAGEVTHGASGFVATGSVTGVLADGSNTHVDVVWRSADGRDWQLVDLRPAVSGAGEAIRITDVAWVGDRYVAVGAVAPLDLGAGPSRGLVLTSPDGISWTERAQVPATWSTAIVEAVPMGTRLVLRGVEQPCATDARALADAGVARTGGQARLWRSDDQGSTLSPLTTPAGVADPPEPSPADPSICPAPDAPNRAQVIAERFGASIGGVLVAADHAVVVSHDLTTTAWSRDLVTWTVGSLPGARPANHDELPQRDPLLAMVDHDGEPVLVSVGWRRDTTERAHGTDGIVQSTVWRLDDTAEGWARQLAGQPIVATGSLRLGTWGHEVVLIGADRSHGAARIWRSHSGPFEPWVTCEPAPAADCSFADVSGLVAGGLDLAELDLTGAIGRDADLTGANLAGASLRLARVQGLALTGAQLSDADLSDASIPDADLTGAVLDGADLRGASVDGSFFLAQSNTGALIRGTSFTFQDGDDLSEIDLAEWDLVATTFEARSALPVPLVEADLSGADLTGARFVGVDLTGATFTGATLESVSFVDVICPDGQPAEGGVVGRQACRL